MEINETLVMDWTRDQVASWLVERGHGQYVSLLCNEHKVDGLVLLLLSENDLKSPPVSIPYLGDIKRIGYDIEILRNKAYQDMNYRGIPSTLLYSQLKRGNEQNYLLGSSSSDEAKEAILVPQEELNNRQVKPELIKMFVALGYLIVVSWISACVMVIVNDRVPDMKKYPPLPDIFLDNIPLIPWAFKLCEICGTFLMIIWVLVCLFHKHRTVLLRRFFALLGTAYLLRSITVVITSLSVPGEHIECSPRTQSSLSEKLHEAYIIWKGAGLSIQGVHTCGDYVFSGHATTVTFLNFFITEYTPNIRQFYLLHLVAWIVNILAIGCILASHEHYSIDVFIAFYITSRLFLYYHSMANNKGVNEKDSRRIKYWFPLYGYLESSMSSRVPNEYQSITEIVLYVFRTVKRVVISIKNVLFPIMYRAY